MLTPHTVFEWHPQLRAFDLGAHRVCFVGVDRRHVVAGRGHARVALELSEPQPVGQLVERVGPEVSPPEVLLALEDLSQRGLIRARLRSQGDSAAERFWSCQGTQRHSVSILGAPGEPRSALENACRQADLPLVDAGATLLVALVEDYLAPAWGPAASLTSDGRTHWLPVQLSGPDVWFGPLFPPNSQGPCVACLQQRLWANRPVERFIARTRAQEVPPALSGTASPGALLAAAGLVCLELERLCHASEPRLDVLCIWNHSSRQLQTHAVARLPQCHVCGDQRLRADIMQQAPRLRSRLKRFTRDGGYRIEPPEQTYARLRPLVDPVTGLIASLGPLETRNDPLRPVWAAAYFVSPGQLREGAGEPFARTSMGKGRTMEQARASAMCEALERRVALYEGDEGFIEASYRELGDKAIAPAELLHFSRMQHAARSGRPGCTRTIPPPPFDPNAVLPWVQAWSLVNGSGRYLPMHYCFAELPSERWPLPCGHDPNGHAAGNCLEEAVLQALLERVERDAVGIWWYNRVRRPGFALEADGLAYIDEVREHYASFGFAMRVLDVTHDLGVPVAVALAHEEASGRYVMGLGAHLESRLAVQRAITEMHQVFDPTGAHPGPFCASELERTDFLFPDGTATGTGSSASAHDDLRDDVQWLVNRVAAAGEDVLLLDYSRPDVPLRTVKVVTPGLRHFWPRFGPGRLYDVPVAMGWLPESLTESALNPKALLL